MRIGVVTDGVTATECDGAPVFGVIATCTSPCTLSLILRPGACTDAGAVTPVVGPGGTEDGTCHVCILLIKDRPPGNPLGHEIGLTGSLCLLSTSLAPGLDLGLTLRDPHVLILVQHGIEQIHILALTVNVVPRFGVLEINAVNIIARLASPGTITCCHNQNIAHLK